MSDSTVRRAGALGDAGYTLTEMLVVIGIICMIAAILTPNLLNQLQRARAKSTQLQLDTLSSAVEMFRSDVGRYPSKVEGLQALLKEPEAVQGWTGPYVKDLRVFKDPWGGPVTYSLGSTGRTFAVKSFGADGEPGGSGVNRDLQSPVSG